MEYFINKGKRLNLILSASYLIVYHVIIGLSFLLKDLRELDSVENGIALLLFTIAIGYIYLIFVDYFKFYNLNTIKIITLIVFIAEISNQCILLVNSFNQLIPQFLSTFFNVIAVLGIIIWIIMVLRIKKPNYSAFHSFRKYAFGQIAAFALGVIISITTMFGGYYDLADLMYLPIAIPYIFVIDLALRLKIK